MRFLKHFFVFFTLVSIVSCGSDDSSSIGDDQATPPTVITNTPTEITGTSAILGGTVTDLGSGDADYRGVCWSLNANPTTSDYVAEADGSGLGTYTVEAGEYNSILPNTTYHARAFAYSFNSDIAYGNDITFTTGDLVTFTVDIPRNINTTRFDIDVIIESSSEDIGGRGVVIDTSPNPTIYDISIDAGYGAGEFGGQISNLNPNTVYYVRPYIYSYLDDDYIYGPEQTFQTTGYYGPAGGYVVFDKGEASDGWRYLEASPEQSSFYNDWGCEGSFISNTFEDFGMGLDNTNQIMSNCSESSFAARTAYYYSYGGYYDWFLPSRLEAIVTMRSLSDLNALENTSYWTSTEVNSSEAYFIYLSSDTIYSNTDYKSNSRPYLPIRRY